MNTSRHAQSVNLGSLNYCFVTYDSGKLPKVLKTSEKLNCVFLVSIANPFSGWDEDFLWNSWLDQLLQLMNDMGNSWAHRRDMFCTSAYEVHHLLNDYGFWKVDRRIRFERIQEVQEGMWVHQRRSSFEYTLPTHQINCQCRPAPAHNFQK